jgi:drug/metabolite transporter (DMT)-like permease
MTAALALVASALWGGADFLGGSVSRRLRPVQVLAVSQALAAAVLLIFVAARGPAALADGAGSWLVWSLGAGLTWAAGMGALYTALAGGTMGVVAPIASCGMVLPVVLALLGGERPGPAQLVGVGVAVLGVVGSAGPDLRGRGPGQRRPVLLALAAAILFGVEIFCLAQGSTSSVTGTLLGMRLSAVTCAAIVLAARSRDRRPLAARDLPPLLALGMLDLAATAAYALAARAGLVSLVAVLASLYPAVTVLLARQFHAERLAGVQRLGVTSVLVGAALIGLGGAAA